VNLSLAYLAKSHNRNPLPRNHTIYPWQQNMPIWNTHTHTHCYSKHSIRNRELKEEDKQKEIKGRLILVHIQI
jgi:hypothetical protein